MYPGFPLNLTDSLLPFASWKRVSNVWVSGRELSTDTDMRSKLALIFETPPEPDQSIVYTTWNNNQGIGPWSLHGHYMVITWSLHGHYMVITWSLHGHSHTKLLWYTTMTTSVRSIGVPRQNVLGEPYPPLSLPFPPFTFPSSPLSPPSPAPLSF